MSICRHSGARVKRANPESSDIDFLCVSGFRIAHSASETRVNALFRGVRNDEREFFSSLLIPAVIAPEIRLQRRRFGFQQRPDNFHLALPGREGNTAQQIERWIFRVVYRRR
jgi:hypothetical protein